MAALQRPRDQLPSHGSRTMVVTETDNDVSGPEAGPSTTPQHHGDTAPAIGVLRLRGGPIRRNRVVWSEETIDNEGMGKKKSKICCIYHRPKKFDESSTESSSGSDDDEPSGDEQGKAQRALGAMKKREKDQGVGGSGQVEGDESSESEGGHGGGDKARPTRKPRRKNKPKHHDNCNNHDHDHKHDHPAKPNRYDHQNGGSGGGTKGHEVQG